MTLVSVVHAQPTETPTQPTELLTQPANIFEQACPVKFDTSKGTTPLEQFVEWLRQNPSKTEIAMVTTDIPNTNSWKFWTTEYLKTFFVEIQRDLEGNVESVIFNFYRSTGKNLAAADRQALQQALKGEAGANGAAQNLLLAVLAEMHNRDPKKMIPIEYHYKIGGSSDKLDIVNYERTYPITKHDMSTSERFICSNSYLKPLDEAYSVSFVTCRTVAKFQEDSMELAVRVVKESQK